MNIDAVRIKNFRNYLGENEFKLNKAITILYGSNGFGKSSFFDALEWCLTGEISRFDKSFVSKDIINHNCDLANAECCVEILFGGNTLSRSFKVVGGDFKNVGIKVTPKVGTVIRGKDNVDNFLKLQYVGSEKPDLFGSLIKQSHILSQDQVTDFIAKDDPKDRFDSLADIMGLKSILYIYQNFKEIRSEVKNSEEKHKDRKRQNENSMELRSKDLVSLDTELLGEIAEMLNITSNVKTLEDVVQTFQKKQMARQQNIGSIKAILVNLKGKGHSTAKGAKDHVSALRDQIRAAEDHISKVKQLNTRVHSLDKNLTQKIGFMKDVIEISNQIKDKLNQVQAFGFSQNIEIKDIVGAAEPKRQRLSKLEYAVASKNQYLSLLQVSRRSSDVSVLMEREKRLIARSTRIDSALKQILILLNDNEDGVIVRLLHDIQSIHSYVQKQNTKSKCPVCSAEHGDNLQHIIADNVSSYETVVKEMTSNASRLMNMKSRYDTRKIDVEKEIKKLKNEISRLGQSINNSKQQVEVMKANTLFDQELFDIKTIDEINLENEQHKDEINQLDKSISLISEVTKLKNNQATKLQELGTQFVGDTSKEAIDNRQQRLRRAYSRIQIYIKNQQSSTKALQHEHDGLFSEMSKLPGDFKLDDYSAQIDDVLLRITEEESQIDTQLQLAAKASDLRKTFEFNEKVAADINRFKKEKAKIAEQLLHCHAVLKSTNTFIEIIGATLGDKAKDFLNTSQSLIQKYYRYLNPLPSYNTIKFDSDNGELNILIPHHDETQFSNVKHTLSSGQLNVLAIAIFLAINQSQKISQLDFVAIDDPIQNMDDVNRFAICDVLGGLNKQLIISTHDLDFVKLFIKKNEPIKSDIQLYFLESPQLKSGKIKRMDFVSEGNL